MISKIQAHPLLEHPMHLQYILLPYPRDPKSGTHSVGWVKNLVCLYLLWYVYNLIKVHHSIIVKREKSSPEVIFNVYCSS